MSMRKREKIQEVLRGINPVEDHEIRPYRVAAVQCNVGLDYHANLRKYLEFSETAISKGAKLIAFPECFLLPWFHMSDQNAYRDYAEPVPGPSIQPFIKLASESNTSFICPVYECYEDRNYFTTVIVSPEGIKGSYRKVHLAHTAFWEENELADSGSELPVFDLGDVNVGILMGWDVFFPDAVRTLVNKGAELIIVPTAAAMESQYRWLAAVSGHAICNNCFMLRINRSGQENELLFYGQSFCVDPFGNLFDQPTFHRDSVMLADLDLNDVCLSRKEFPFYADRRPDVYEL